jgi:hypothetical protein
MPNFLDKRFRAIHFMIEGAREQKAHETTQDLPKIEKCAAMISDAIARFC